MRDLDPVIERVIERCIETDPSSRPSSALQVAASLPGGDPLAAALAAGETPSPEMVAAAPKKGTLRPSVALGLLTSFIALILISMWLSAYGTLYRLIPMQKSPEVLKEQATQIANSFGYSANADRMYSLAYDRDLITYLEERLDSVNPREVLRSGQPAMMYFWYRQSPLPLRPYDTQWVTIEDPPNEIPGMVRMKLDTDGRLIYFEAVPEQVQRHSETPPASSHSPHFETLFRLAGLDMSKFQLVASEWTPPKAYDQRQAWSGVFPAYPELTLRVEAAMFQGKPVYFEIVSPWSKPLAQAWQPALSQKVGTWLLLGVFFATIAVATLLALRNLRYGRGDRKGAFRLAMFLFVLRMIFWVLTTHHIATTNEFLLLVTGLQSALFWASFIGLLYLALEPYLRRRWPQRVISWNRLLAGDFRDPMVGRDILIGAVFGGLCIAIMMLRAPLSALSGHNILPDPVDGFETSMSGISAFSHLLINQISAGLLQSLMIVFLLLVLSLVLRNDRVGIAVGTVMMLALFVSPVVTTYPLVGIAAVSAVVLILIFATLRFGAVCSVMCVTVFHLWIFFPLTIDFSAWYATAFAVDAVLLLALTVYGYYIALGGQPMLSGKLLREE